MPNFKRIEADIAKNGYFYGKKAIVCCHPELTLNASVEHLTNSKQQRKLSAYTAQISLTRAEVARQKQDPGRVSAPGSRLLRDRFILWT
jgi:hypothetical protein